ncbi:subtilisin-like protein [Cryphonectria parasitica EP155]|uniref:Subtilisin-like protein n=1 Tax=Cryphonectria parasitica (strain ATCC 38755 / EP155) TaxID=660469 RepID=A0A9P4YAC4_CRYP1|nr:subtilisin-like protein [Cryphonectria parasitica EP155]KAF3769696.1 subtilisin-like protein [Cryphonectria parasitica EP155]
MNTGLEVINAGSLPPLNNTNCDYYVTQECIRTQYSITKGDKAAPGNELGIFESLGDHYSKEDLDVFWSTLYPEIPNGTYPIEKNIDGAFGAITNVSDAGIESDLDFEASQPLIWPQRTVLFQTDDEFYEINETTANTPIRGFWNTFYDALDGSYCTYSAYGETGDCVAPECLDPVYPDPNPGGYKGQLQCGVYEPTNVISISYGGGESDVPAYYTKRRCNEIMKLGLQGVTIVISSGDDGVGSFPGDPTESGCAGPDETVFYPASDATCPYVLSVGSTQFIKTASDNSSVPKYTESSTTRFPSGGGFSNYFDTPDYQKDQVTDYFDSVTLNFTGYTDPGVNFSTVGDGVYKIGGRGYPDVAAIGDYYVIRAEGTFGRVGGTSLSAPIWAAVLTRINEERLAAGKSTLGFINPTLYAHPEVFFDITNGSNPNCGTTGFLATEGWDPVSGLGTPVYPKLLSLLQDL